MTLNYLTLKETNAQVSKSILYKIDNKTYDFTILKLNEPVN